MWYYTINGQQHGPLDDPSLDQAIAQKVITNDTLVWKEGLAEWMPLRQVSRVSNVVSAAPGVCSICGKQVGADNLIDLVGNRVCAACKPKAVQMLREGVTPMGAGSAWSEGKKVVTRDKAELPLRCFKCNEPAMRAPLTRKLQWHNPFWYVLIFAGLLIYVVVAIAIRSRATVEIHLCDRHLKRRKNFTIAGWSGAGLSVLLFIVGIAMNQTILTALSPFVLLVAIIGGLAGSSVARASRIKDGTVWLVGAGKEFIASLPRWPG